MHGDTEHVLVFIHGNTLDSAMWNAQIRYFNRNYSTLVYDMAGFGKSSPPAEIYSRHEDLRSLLDELNISKVILIGLSLGGDVALDFALEYKDRVNGLVLVDSGLGGYELSQEFQSEWQQVEQLARSGKLNEAKRLWLSNSVFKTTMDDPNTRKDLTRIIDNYSGFFWTNNPVHKRPEVRARYRLETIDIPTLIIAGENDSEDFLKVAELLHNSIRNSTLQIIPKAGHMSNMDQPEEFNRLVDEFIATHKLVS